MSDGTAVSVRTETKEKIDEACKFHNCTHRNLVAALVEEVNLKSLVVESDGYREWVKTQDENKLNQVKQLYTDNELPKQRMEKALELINVAIEDGKFQNNKQPKTIAASAEYAAGLYLQENLTQREMMDKYNLSAIPIRETYQELVHVYDKNTEKHLKKVMKMSSDGC